ncbi:hypothetical protein ACFQ4O_09835 [Methylopila musalis]|uniref:UrcA family protein n=1 Tax=Methylopila musalis TaxID=1134781 RepID=A0ABW3Z809_9HYPH
MRRFIAPLGLAFGVALTAFAAAPASAAPVTRSVIAVTDASTPAACRTVERRVRSGGVERITRTRECTRPRYEERRVYRDDRRVYRDERRAYRSDRGYRAYERPRYQAPGLTINVR